MPVLPALHLVKIQMDHSKKELLTYLLNALFDMHHQGSSKILEWVAYTFSRGIFLTQELNQSLWHCRQNLYQLSYREAQSKGQGAMNNDSEMNLSSTSDQGE